MALAAAAGGGYFGDSEQLLARLRQTLPVGYAASQSDERRHLAGAWRRRRHVGARVPTWLWIVIVVVAVLAAGALRERWRLNGLSKWCRQRGFVPHAPLAPGTHPPMASLVARCNARGARRRGAGVSMVVNGVQVTCGEHETTEPGRKAGLWHAIAAWPIHGAFGPIVLWPKVHGAVDEALAAVTGGGSDTQVLARLDELLRELPAARRMPE